MWFLHVRFVNERSGHRVQAGRLPAGSAVCAFGDWRDAGLLAGGPDGVVIDSAIEPNVQLLTVRFVTDRSGHRVEPIRLPCPRVSLEGGVNAIGHE